MKALDLIDDVSNETAILSAVSLEKIIFTYLDIHYCQAQALVHSLIKTDNLIFIFLQNNLSKAN